MSYAKFTGVFGSGGGGGGSGTVTSVGLADGSTTPIYTVSGSPVTTSGTLTLTLSTESANLIFAGPTSGSAAQPTFRSIVAADLPTGNLTDAGTDGITVTGGTGAIIGSGTSLAQHVADTSHNGYLSSTDWNTFNGKQSALTIGNLTDAGTDGITVTGGTGAVIGSGTSIAQQVANTSHNGYLSSTDWNTFNGKLSTTLSSGDIFVGNGSNVAAAVAMSGDATLANTGAITLATVNTNTGSFGSSTAIPNFTVNGKGLITAAGTNVVVAPAGTLSGTTLNSTVVTSSLTTVGTIGTGTWQGTAVASGYGGTGISTSSSTGVPVISSGTWSVDSVLPISLGGTDNGSLAVTNGGVIYTDGTKLQNTGAGTSGQFLKSVGAGEPVWASVSGSGAIVQVQSTTLPTTFVTSATSYTNVTGLSVSITPTSSSNNILVFVNIQGSQAVGSNRAVFQLVRGSTPIAVGNVVGSRSQASGQFASSANTIATSLGISYLDSPATTSSTTYQIQCYVSAGSGSIYVNQDETYGNDSTYVTMASTITVMEVVA